MTTPFYLWMNGEVKEYLGTIVGKRNVHTLYQTGEGRMPVVGYNSRKKARVAHSDLEARRAHKRARDKTGLSNKQIRAVKPPDITFVNWCKIIYVLERVPKYVPKDFDIEAEYTAAVHANMCNEDLNMTNLVDELTPNTERRNLQHKIITKILKLTESQLASLDTFINTL